MSGKVKLASEVVLPNFEDVREFGDIQARFFEAARSIFFAHDLVYDDSDYRCQISALELYLYHPEVWPDPTTHGIRFKSSEQLESGTWYIHRRGKPAPNRSGIDITAGSSSKNIFAGLLIAAIGERDGSATALKGVVRAGNEYSFDRKDRWGEKEKDVLAKINGKRISDGPLRLVSSPVPRKGTLWVGPRKGLSDKIKEPFRDCHLRLATWQTGPRMKPLPTTL
jgi:hypothetical protein